jgi:hypothetical protein
MHIYLDGLPAEQRRLYHFYRWSQTLLHEGNPELNLNAFTVKYNKKMKNK